MDKGYSSFADFDGTSAGGFESVALVRDDFAGCDCPNCGRVIKYDPALDV